MARPFIPVQGCASVELIYSFGSLIFENRFHVAQASDFSLTELETLRQAVDTWDTNSWKSFRNSAVTLTRIKTKALHASDAPMEEYQVNPPRAGTLSGLLMPLGTAFCIKITSELAGRSQRGRLYMGGLDSQTLQGGSQQILSTFANNACVALHTLRQVFEAASQTMVIVSYMKDGAWRTEGQKTTIRDFTYSDLNIDSQRRRLAGRGRT
jgi:hypothetical protein